MLFDFTIMKRVNNFSYILLFGVLLGLCSSAWADSYQDFSRQLSYFYLHPTKASFAKFQQDANRYQSQLEQKQNGADILVAVMIAKISGTKKWPIIDGNFGRIARQILARKTRLARYVWDDSKVDPGKLDIWWVSYFATGDKAYLDKIFRYVGLPKPKHDVMRKMVIAAANWSFKSNCRQHKSVLEYARRQLWTASLTTKRKTFLKDCITKAQSASIQRNTAVQGDGVPASSDGK